MNWRQATDAQLHEIRFNDAGASMRHKAEAEAEMLRRKRRKHQRKQCKLIPTYHKR